MKLIPLLCLILPGLALADLTLLPGQKPKERAKDIVRAQEERYKNGFNTPEAISKEVNFVTGQSVVVELEAATASLAPVKFIIRQAPKFGVLSEVRPHPNPKKCNLGLLIYTHTGEPTDLADSFTFVAKLSEGPTSLPATVTLKGRMAVANIEILKHPLFKPLQAGTEDVGEFVLKNTGTAPFSADLTWPAPFFGPPHIDLAVGVEQAFLVKAKPLAPGTSRLDLPLQTGNTKTSLRAVLECIQPYILTPTTLELSFDPVTGARSGSVKITNVSSLPLALTLDANQRVAHPSDIQIGPGETHECRISMKPDDVAAFRGEVWFIRDPHKEKLLVSAAAEPAQLVLADPKQATIDFGKMDRGTDATKTITVKNLGGAPAAIQTLVAPPFFLATPSSELTIPPASSKDIIIAFKPDMPGTYEKSFKLTTNTGELALTAKALMIDPKRPNMVAGNRAADIENPHNNSNLRGMPTRPTAPAAPTALPVSPTALKPPAEPAPAPTAAPPRSVRSSDTEGSSPISRMSAGQRAILGYAQQFGIGLETLPAFRSELVDPMQAVRALDIGPDYAVIAWLLPEEKQPSSVRIEASRQVFNKELKTMLKTWEEVKSWTTAPAPADAGAARIEGLQPERQYEFRVLGVDSSGRLSRATEFVTIATPPKPVVTSGLIVGSIIALLLAVAGWNFVRQRRNVAVPRRERLATA